jgi:hypothetical protein
VMVNCQCDFSIYFIYSCHKFQVTKPPLYVLEL